jgi:hypothetical protein
VALPVVGGIYLEVLEFEKNNTGHGRGLEPMPLVRWQ